MPFNRPQPGEYYKHFKGNIYQITVIAKNTETEEEMVIYQTVYGDKTYYARPLNMFMSEVEHEKYPDVTQKYRFEKVEADNDEAFKKNKISSNLEAFFNTKSYKKKIEIIKYIYNNEELNNNILDNMAASMDCVIDEEDIERKYESILKYLITMSKYECERLR